MTKVGQDKACDSGALSKYANDAVESIERNIRDLVREMARDADALRTPEGRAAAKALRQLSVRLRRGDHYQTGWSNGK